MREIHLFVRFQRILLVASDPGSDDLWGPRSAKHRLGRVASHLLMLGVELRGEAPPCPRCFLRSSALCAIEVALLAAPRNHHPFEALDHLATLQQARLDGNATPTFEPWRLLSPELHLQRAFWQLAGLTQEGLAACTGPARHEQHAPDLANSLLFAAVTCRAWERALRWGSLPLPPTEPPFSGSGIPRGRLSRKESSMRRTTRRSSDRSIPALATLGEKALLQVKGASGRFSRSPESTEEAPQPPRVTF